MDVYMCYTHVCAFYVFVNQIHVFLIKGISFYYNIKPPEADDREYTNKFKYKVPVSGKLYPPLAISAYLGPPPAISVYGSPKS